MRTDEFLGVCGMVIALALPARAEVYRNTQYGFRVPSPAEFPLCPHISATNDGVIVSLDENPGCHHMDDHPNMSIAGSYTSGPEYADIKSEVADYCKSAIEQDKAAVIGSTPHIDRIGSLPAFACRINHPDGNIDVVAVAWSTVIDDSHRPIISYCGGLHTTKARFDVDFDRFRAFMKSVRFFYPETNCEMLHGICPGDKVKH